MLLAVAAACSSETIEVPGETVVVEKEVIKTVEVPGETVIQEVVKEVQVPGETVVVEKVVTETVEVPGETVVVKEEVVKTVEVPGETVVKEVVKTVEVPGQTVVVEKEVVKTVEVPGETVVVEKEVVKEVPMGYVTDPTTGKVVSAPQYGGALHIGRSADPHTGVDTWYGHGAADFSAMINEKLGIADWATPRDVFNFRTTYIPDSIIIGRLAESWDISPDGLTYTFNIRQGVNWHNKAPMNGRELTAQDIEYNYHRYLGLGSGFTKGSEFVARDGPLDDVGIESVTATDKYTVIFKLKAPSLLVALKAILTVNTALIYPPEVLEESGGTLEFEEWAKLVGTGPYELTDWVEGSSMTYVKNPNYWGYDEKYPENRLPYIDGLRFLMMPEEATRLAAMRSGKIDFLHVAAGTQIKSIDTLVSLAQTNPEIVLEPFSYRSEAAFAVNTQKAPTNDLRVRQAMQMALDHETINNIYFRGYGDPRPQTGWGDALIGYTVPFEEWPAELQGYFNYDPERAEALLDAAGYKRGADGIRFKIGLVFVPGPHDASYMELAAKYYDEIGIDVELKPIESAAWGPGITEGTYEHMIPNTTAYEWNPMGQLRFHTSDAGWNTSNVNDPVYDAMVEAAEAATTLEEQQRLVIEAAIYSTEQHWRLWGSRVPQFNVRQPWVIGYNGEVDLGDMDRWALLARFWIDSELKEAMGY